MRRWTRWIVTWLVTVTLCSFAMARSALEGDKKLNLTTLARQGAMITVALHVLVREWQATFEQFLLANPDLESNFRQLLSEEFLPALSDSSVRIYQAGKHQYIFGS